MKRIVVMLAAAMLMAAPAFAAGISQQYSGPMTGKGGTQTNVITKTDVENANVIANKNSEVNINAVENDGGNQANVNSEVKVKNSNVIANDGSKANIGVVKNK